VPIFHDLRDQSGRFFGGLCVRRALKLPCEQMYSQGQTMACGKVAAISRVLATLQKTLSHPEKVGF